MAEMTNVDGILEVIKSITSNRESGRLEINSSRTPGTFFFNEGKLVDARLGSLSGFQAVNAALALRNVDFSFDHVVPALHASTITPNERVVLEQFFGIETAEMEEPREVVESDPEWNATPEQVVPLAELEVGGTRRFAFVWRPRVALAIVVCLALVTGLVLGAVALRSRVKALQQPTVLASTAETTDSPAPAVADAERSKTSNEQATPNEHAIPDERDSNAQDLTGDWRVINTVEKTAYKLYGSMQVGFRLKINQRGNEFAANGEKFFENGQTLAAGSRTPIHVRGSIEGDKVIATFIEEGRARRSNGRFVWKLQRGGEALAGTFVSTAANSSGKSAVTRE